MDAPPLPDAGPPRFDHAFCAQLQDLLIWRRDVRHFRPDPVPSALAEELLDIVQLAPSVGNSQPWRFVQLESASARHSVRASFARCNADALAGYDGERAKRYASLKLSGLDRAPLQWTVFCDEATEQGHGLGRLTMPQTLAWSVVGAIHVLWLAARARGLGLGWVSILDPAEVSGALDVPPAWRFVAHLCIGWPDEEEATPELERQGWQARTSLGRSVLIR
jgi:5,6-dimethylbenzimidazole synthase